MSELYGWDSRHVPMDGRVLLGSTVATLADWAQALGVPEHMVCSRLGNGDMVLQALRSTRERRRDVRVRYEHDAGVQEFVRAHPYGAQRDDIGAFFGQCAARVAQVQRVALAKLEGCMGPEWAEILGDAAVRQKDVA